MGGVAPVDHSPAPDDHERVGAARRMSSETGQSIVLLVVMLAVLLGMCGLVIDYGNWMVQKRQLQNATDAAALAGAAKIPGGVVAENAGAQSEYASNGQPTDQVTITPSTDMTSNDSVTVTATRIVNTWFTRLLAINSVTITTTSRATIQSFTQVTGQDAMPWGVLQGTYVPDQPYSIYTKTSGSSGNNGALSLPYVNGANCPVPNGANAYQNEIDGTLSPCPITLGESVDTKTGDNSGPTAQGLNARITTWQTVNQIVQFNADGTTTLLEPDSPQLVLIPILTNPSGQAQWPSGASSPMTVVGFAYFVITSCGNPLNPTYCGNSDGKQVNGVFVSLDGTASTGTGGAYKPNAGTAYMIGLTQ
jgi:Flp pilus assembly protein TadG